MPEQPITKPIVEDAQEQLTTAPTLIELVQGLNTKPILQKEDSEYVAHREYDAEPVVQALRCRELGGYSWGPLRSSGSTTRLQRARRAQRRGTTTVPTPRSAVFSR